MFWYIILSIILLLLSLLLVPIKVKFNYSALTNFDENNQEEKLKVLNTIDIYLFYFIKIKRIKTNNEAKDKEKKSQIGKIVFDMIADFFLEFLNFKKMSTTVITSKDLSKLKKNMYIQNLDLNIGVNLENMILNAYVISFLNSAINLYFAKNADRINLSKTKYFTYVSNKILNIKVNSIIRFKLIKTIHIILKIIFKAKKLSNKQKFQKAGKSLDNTRLSTN